MNEEKINLADYTFEQGSIVEIPGELLTALLDVLTMVENQETKTVMLNEETIATGKGKTEQKMYDAKTFFSQEPKPAMTIMGASAMDMKFNLLHWFMEAVKAGKAIKKHEIRKDEQVSQPLA